MSHHILLADDDRLVLGTLGNGLRQAGYTVTEAASGEAALAFAQHQPPDLAVLDKMCIRDSLGGVGAALGELSDLAGHDREPSTLLARPRRFHRRVEGEQVGLEGDLVDHADDVGDLAAAGVDRRHRDDGPIHHLPALLGLAAGGNGQLVGLPGVLGALLDRRGQLLSLIHI